MLLYRGIGLFMSDFPDQPNLDDVMTPTEDIHPDHREHAKEGKHLNETELERRTQHERDIVRAQKNNSG